ncbi:PHP domain-containing protein [Prochlorothrix hollandica]|uniref:Histidinol phosphatase n=1 Tax=Prochlorothrix hollandica PCC 9006 = CALU 1027 TaxID=317619 RepID=A0A0M2PVX5_PROHO|nr:PHP domain-containing protein [Prochlorothrix hollandica]KKI99252.1 histidinol phosphatase [Prochlorothrix hollandica PCC 9006 = CALU 1027]
MIELHCHTTYSDGTLTPQQLVATALAAGVKALAITDHDTLGGWAEAEAAAAGTGLEIVPGVELSTIENGRSLHVLGFYPDRDRLRGPLADRLAGRQRRAETMVAKLEALGYGITLPVLGESTAPGRPHLAKALVAAGHVGSINEAFDRFLGEGKPAHVAYEPFSATEGIRLLRSCGAVTVWAHPPLFQGGSVAAVLPKLLEAGLQGLEVCHPSYGSRDRRQLESLCQRHGLLPSGGSDYHGPGSNGKDTVSLNALGIPWAWLDDIKAAAGR